ncbi:pentapeptide repeat-containing protein [Bradyrhizobium diazoefficiens]|uniref:pentapeptide repeat-containing protein n=1 Tax=Bradyrhizobium diazoefficiens TaxID=1355477 RepID=UPI0015B50C62|nr:pentapeptide repeat-containing protein [Bradyrhizobium diazoefficiens]QLD45622.1 pentapeptide repeat-containing protein [Bradyrhizobium diazoefficiens]
MREVARRTLIATAGFLGAGFWIASPVVARQHGRRVTQSVLSDAIAQHVRWIADAADGARLVFAGCDLSGLDFLSATNGIVDLRGADLTNADLSGITGNEVSFHRASLQDARLTSSMLVAPIFSGATLRRAHCDQVIWGWPRESQRANAPSDDASPAATFINTDLDGTDFNGARVRGYFCGAQFTNASLVEADLRFSRFDGHPTYCPNSFSGSRLVLTKFEDACISATRFRFAEFSGAEVAGAKIAAGCTWPSALDIASVSMSVESR